MQAIVGVEHVLTDEAAQPYLEDWRKRYRGQALAVVRPGSTQEVAAVIKLCYDAGVPIVTVGGNTGLCGGATPDSSGRSVVLSTGRLNRVREIDTDNDTITVEAGCVLQNLQEAARKADRLFALSLAAEGSCTIGGNLATNAGGTQVLRYGNAREQALGLEVVTPQGEIWDGLRGLRKDNTGYDLRDLFIGSEGTLGIITAATLKLYPVPVAQRTALLALRSLPDAVAMLSRARSGFGPSLTGFEVMAGHVLEAVVKLFPQQRIPFDGDSAKSAWFALLELSDSESAEHAQTRFEHVLGQAIEDGLVLDAAIAESVAQSKALWHLRESIPLAEAELGKSVKHDVSIPISRIAEFVDVTNAALQTKFPGVKNIVFGHLGDGNLHYNVSRSEDQTEQELLGLQDQIYQLVHDSVHAFNGSISAEHGVGQLKTRELPRYKSELELRLMRQIKVALDPKGLLNPGKVLYV
ncbi:FAD-binding oxidoreductase [Orrella marina]|uniref:Hydroxyacid dehydrogenase n=1 Tax=Orrella marina TaxID=2163011 RepID=A0A2R4XQ30_9BURK|nr:FAD-binding oxidoreductase [Orrella marina]AWB35799.1 hydroxyacid dehydrogenase [Orrella marina]